MVSSNTVCMKSKCVHENQVSSYTFLGETFEDFWRTFQDPTSISMNLPSTKQKVCVESYIWA